MTGGYHPVLHALSLAPRSARPGETICIEFRARNLGTLASPPATVAFVLPDGLDALAATEVDVEPVAPGQHVVATILARVGMPFEDRSELALQAVLRLPDAELGTNVCALVVRSRAVLDGPASGTFVEPLGSDLVRVRAEVVNEGDGPARAVRVSVPAPIGCAPLDGDAPLMLEVERLDVGEHASLAFEARVVAPVAQIAADAGEVTFGDGLRVALPVREVVVPEPAIAPPRVGLLPSRRRVDIAVEARNDGWADAHDVRVEISLPKPMKFVGESAVVSGIPVTARTARRRGSGDCAFAQLAVRGDACTIVVATVPARECVRVAIAATHPAGWGGGTIGVRLGSHDAQVPFVPEHMRDVRLRVVETPRVVFPGDNLCVRAQLVNGGDVPETLRVGATGAWISDVGNPPVRTLAPGSAAVMELAVRVDDDAPSGTLAFDVVVSDAEGERARSEACAVVRNRPVMQEPESPAVVSATSSGVALRATLHGPEEVVVGAPFGLRIELDVDRDVESLVVRVPAVAGATYVAGSTSLDGCALLDRGGCSLLAEGLVLRAVPAGTRVTIAWSCVAEATACDGALTVGAVFDADGVVQAPAPVEIRARACDAFAMRPNALPYHVEACATTPEITAAPEAAAAPESAAAPETGAAEPVASPAECLAAPEPALPEAAREVVHEDPSESLLFVLRLDADCVEDASRLARETHGGLVSHVLAMSAFLPNAVSAREPIVADAFRETRLALRDVFDRLFVKLRIPGFYVAADDLEDPQVRRALVALFEALHVLLPAAGSDDAERGRIDQARAAEVLALLADAPYGAPPVLRVLVGLVASAHVAHDPNALDAHAEFAAALASYAELLDGALARYEGVPLELFDDALARSGADRALDDARAAVLGALRACAAAEEVTC